MTAEEGAAGALGLKLPSTKPITFLGIGLILLGAMAMYAPQQSGMAVGILVGIALVVSRRSDIRRR